MLKLGFQWFYSTVRWIVPNTLSARECECRYEEGESRSVHSRSFQSSAVHGRWGETFSDTCNIVCALTSYNYREDILELEEGDVIPLLDVLQHINEVVTIAEAAETVEMTETAADEEQCERIPWRRNRRFESDFFLPWIEGNTSKQIWGTMTNTLGDQGNSARVFGIKGNWA